VRGREGGDEGVVLICFFFLDTRVLDGVGLLGGGIDGSKAGLDMMVVVVVSSLIQVRVVCVWTCGCVYLLAWPAHIDL